MNQLIKKRGILQNLLTNNENGEGGGDTGGEGMGSGIFANEEHVSSYDGKLSPKVRNLKF